MRVVCDECGTGNDVESDVLARGAAVCRRCQFTLLSPNTRAPNATAALLRAPPRVFTQEGPPLDASVAGEDDAADWSALLVGNEPGPAGPAPPPPQWAPAGAAPAAVQPGRDERPQPPQSAGRTPGMLPPPSVRPPPARPAPPPAPPPARPAPPPAPSAAPVPDFGGFDELGGLDELASIDGQSLDGLGLGALGLDAVGLDQLGAVSEAGLGESGSAAGGASALDDPAHAWLAALDPDSAGDLGSIDDADGLSPTGLGAHFGPPAHDLSGEHSVQPASTGFVFGADDAGSLSDKDDGPLDVPAPTGWRVRAANGLVYELPDANAVVAWLQGKSELAGIVLARGSAMFQPVDAWPEVSSRVRRGRPSSPISADVGGPGLDLDVEAGPRRSTAVAASAGSVASSRGSTVRPVAEGDVRNARRPRISVDAPLGFGWVLAAALGATAAAVLGAGLIGDMSPADGGGEAVSTEVASAPDEAAIVAAIGNYEAGHFNGAVEQLAALGPTGDPRVERYLALALHRQGRDREARAALERYRRAMVRTSGEHGLQVRKVRD